MNGRTRARRWSCTPTAGEDGVRAARVAAREGSARGGQDDPAQIHHLFAAPSRRAFATAARRPHRRTP